MHPVLVLLILLAGGVVGAVIAGLLKMPLWAITGAILGSAVTSLFLPWGATMPSWVSFTAQVLVGTAVGASVQPGFGRQLAKVALPAALAVGGLLVITLSGSAVIAFLGLTEPTEAFLGLLPAGLGEMVAAAASVGADSALVAGMHVVRILLVLWTLPLLLRWASTWRRKGEQGDAGRAPSA